MIHSNRRYVGNGTAAAAAVARPCRSRIIFVRFAGAVITLFARINFRRRHGTAERKKYHINCIVLTTTGDLLSATTRSRNVPDGIYITR